MSSQGPPLPPRGPRKEPALVRQGCVSPVLSRHPARCRCVTEMLLQRDQGDGALTHPIPRPASTWGSFSHSWTKALGTGEGGQGPDWALDARYPALGFWV